MSARIRAVRATALSAAVMVVLALLAGCAPVPDEGWSPSAPSAQIVVDEQTGTIDPASMPGATGQRLRVADPNVAARWTALPGEQPFNRRIEQEVRAAIEAFVTVHGTAPYAPQAQPEGSGFADRGCLTGTSALDAAELLADARFAAADPDSPGLVIACDVVLAAGTLVGERLRIVQGTAETVTGDRTVTIVSDTATGTTGTVAEMLAPDAREALWRAAVSAGRHAAGALWDVDVALPDEAALDAFVGSLTALSLDAEGGITAVAPDGISAPEIADLAHPEAAQERLAFRIPGEEASALLGPLGRQAVAAAAAGSAYTGPQPVSAGAETPDCTLVACVALTYDDGPDSTLPELLDHLEAAHAAASFFVLGGKVGDAAAELRAIAEAGHEIGNHSHTHIDFGAVPVPVPPPPAAPGATPAPAPTPTPEFDPDADLDTMRGEIGACTAAIADTTGVTPTLFRPPYGSYDDRIFSATSMPVILWDVDTLDWQTPGVDVVIDRAVGESSAGSIVLLHSTHQSSIDATPGILAGFADRGLQVVTVTQLFNGDVPSGSVRRAG